MKCWVVQNACDVDEEYASEFTVLCPSNSDATGDEFNAPKRDVMTAASTCCNVCGLLHHVARRTKSRIETSMHLRLSIHDLLL